MTLVRLEGSPKQIKWAESIRAAYVAALRAETLEPSEAAKRDAYLSRLTAYAKDWIDGRYDRYNAVTANLADALRLEEQEAKNRQRAAEADFDEAFYQSQYRY